MFEAMVEVSAETTRLSKAYLVNLNCLWDFCFFSCKDSQLLPFGMAQVTTYKNHSLFFRGKRIREAIAKELGEILQLQTYMR